MKQDDFLLWTCPPSSVLHIPNLSEITKSVPNLLSENRPFLQNLILPWVKIHMLHEKFMHAIIVFVCTEIKLKSMKPIHQWIHLFMENKKIFLCSHSKGYVSN